MLVNLQKDFTEILSHCLVNNVQIEILWFQRRAVFIYLFVTQLYRCDGTERILYFAQSIYSLAFGRLKIRSNYFCIQFSFYNWDIICSVWEGKGVCYILGVIVWSSYRYVGDYFYPKCQTNLWPWRYDRISWPSHKITKLNAKSLYKCPKFCLRNIRPMFYIQNALRILQFPHFSYEAK